jgi:hypothetical protein
MMLPLRAVLLTALATALAHANAQAQTPDEGALLPADIDVIDEPIDAMPVETETDVPVTRRKAEITREFRYENWIVLEPRGATRREIISRLFAGREVEIEWRNKAFADEALRGRFKGPPTELARRLLERANYVMAYNTSGDLARIIILGSDPPSVTRSADAPSPVRPKTQASEAERRRQAIEATRRAIKDAQERR